MSQDQPLTAEEAARLLKISKYTLYELIKRGEIPAQRIGRQLRIDPEALSQYLFGRPHAIPTSPGDSSYPAGASYPSNGRPKSEVRSPSDPAGSAGFPNQANFDTAHSPTSHSRPENHFLRFAGSHEPVIELLREFLHYTSPKVEVPLVFSGSMEGLIALFRREADIAGVHLWDEQTQEYNLPYIQHILPGEKILLINLVQRTQGWIVPPGNPMNLKSWADISREGLHFVNRQKGSGTRIRLDGYLHRAHIAPDSIQGYLQEENTHFGVALRIANEQANAGLGIQAAAQKLGLAFVPLFQERYDLACLAETSLQPAWPQLLATLQSPAFHAAINQLAGYDTSLTGQIINPENSDS